MLPISVCPILDFDAQNDEGSPYLLRHCEDSLIRPAQDDHLLAIRTGLHRQPPHPARRLPSVLREPLDELSVVGTPRKDSSTLR
jgi:hypothetical protein